MPGPYWQFQAIPCFRNRFFGRQLLPFIFASYIKSGMTTTILGKQDVLDLSTEIVICSIGFVFALTGAAIDLTGEALTSRGLKAYLTGNRDAVFQKVKRQNRFTLENQNGKIEKCSNADIGNYLDDMFISPKQFVTLTAPVPKQNVRFVQACMQADQVELELGLEDNGTHLVHKLCSKEECRRIFLEFYHGQFAPKPFEYQPLPF